MCFGQYHVTSIHQSDGVMEWNHTSENASTWPSSTSSPLFPVRVSMATPLATSCKAAATHSGVFPLCERNRTTSLPGWALPGRRRERVRRRGGGERREVGERRGEEESEGRRKIRRWGKGRGDEEEEGKEGKGGGGRRRKDADKETAGKCSVA